MTGSSNGQVQNASAPFTTGGGGGGSGTVTGVSVASANGFSGSVANSTTTPTISISTTVMGLLKGNSTTGAVSAATAETDYVSPTGYRYLNTFYPETYGAVGNGTTDDTVAIQAAITAATAVRGTVRLGDKTYLISDALNITDACTIEGLGSYTLYGSVFANVEAVNVPTVPPYISGSVIMQTGAGKNAVNITALGTSVHMRQFGITFGAAIRFTNTGHGIYWNPPTFTTGGNTYRDSGSMWSDHQNITVFGHDGNHYGLWLVNPLQFSSLKFQSFGGGGICVETNGAININNFLGNCTFTAPYCNTFIAGTGHPYYIKNTSGETILQNFLHPQAWVKDERASGLTTSVPVGGSAGNPTAGQHTFYVDPTATNQGTGSTRWLNIVLPDLETNIDYAGPVMNRSAGTFISPGLINGQYGGIYQESDSDGWIMGSYQCKYGALYSQLGGLKIGGIPAASFNPTGITPLVPGLEVYYLTDIQAGGTPGSGVGVILSYDRSTSTYHDLQLEGARLALRAGGAEQILLSSTSVLVENLLEVVLPTGVTGKMVGFGCNGAADLLTFSYASNGITTIQSSNFGPLVVQTQSNKNLQLNAGTGNVGVGTPNLSTDYRFPFEVIGNSANVYITAALRGSSTISRRASLIFSSSYGSTINNEFEFGTDLNANGTHDFYIHDDTNNVNPVYIASTGFLGLGNQLSPTSTVHFNGSQGLFNRSITAARTLDATDRVILANGTFSVTLPTAVGIKDRVYTIQNTGSGAITIATTSSQTIYTTTGAATTVALAQGQFATVTSDGANWFKIG